MRPDLNLIALTLHGYAVKPQVLDFVLSSAGMAYNTDAGRIDDWYALPRGHQADHGPKSQCDHLLLIFFPPRHVTLFMFKPFSWEKSNQLEGDTIWFLYCCRVP